MARSPNIVGTLLLTLLAILGTSIAGCTKVDRSKPSDGRSDAGSVAATASTGTSLERDLASIADAEDERRSSKIGDRELADPRVDVRRRAVRALARIADARSIDVMARSLSDEDEEVARWAAYGLGTVCKSNEDRVVAALLVRAASWKPAGDGGSDRAFPSTVARALGKCSSEAAERTLTAWLGQNEPAIAPFEDVAFALGDVATKKKALAAETQAALVKRGSDAGALALYPFTRLAQPLPEHRRSLADAARKVLHPASPYRIFAIRVLGRIGSEGISDLATIPMATTFSYAERAEAIRGLKEQGKQAKAPLTEALYRMLAPERLGPNFWGTFEYVLAIELLDAITLPIAPTLADRMAARLGEPIAVEPAFAERLATWRCKMASLIAGTDLESPQIRDCDPAHGEATEVAQLSVLLRVPLLGNRRHAWEALAHSRSPRVRNAAVEAIATHPELASYAHKVLADALTSEHAGVVATAAETIHGHPDRVLTATVAEKKRALDTKKRIDTNAVEVAPIVAEALRKAAFHPWAEDAIETRALLLDAASSLSLPWAIEIAEKQCVNANVTLRQKAERVLTVLKKPRLCVSTDLPSSPSSTSASSTNANGLQGSGERPPESAKNVPRIIFSTNSGDLSIALDPTLAPRSTAHFVALAKSGFFRGIVVHRVAPGFVVQFGDPGGDGYGGSGKLLRCETSPVPFRPLDVGIALAGRDTGSSQLFITLARYPHLDGEYSRIGSADGPWESVALGDVIRDARVQE